MPGLGALMQGAMCISTTMTHCSRQWCTFGVMLERSRGGVKTSHVSDTLGVESIHSAGQLCPYLSPSLSAHLCELFSVMKPAAARGLCSLEMSQIAHRVALSLAAVRWGLDYKQLHADKALKE